MGPCTILPVFLCLLVLAVTTGACAATSTQGAAGSCPKVCDCRSYFQVGPTGAVQLPANQEILNMLKAMKQELNQTAKSMRDLKAIKQELSQTANDLKADMKKLGDRCNASPVGDCSELRQRGIVKSGVYQIHPFGENFWKVINVYCDMETVGGGWTVIQRRYDGSEDFYRSWAEYSAGFGKGSGEYWLGNDVINKLSSAKPLELRLDMENWSGKKGFAKYREFSVSGSAEKYRLHVAGYSGTAGDGLQYHNGQAFSTKDVDNDGNSGQCAVRYHGAWWYNSCYWSNLNGRYYHNVKKVAKEDGADWYYLDGQHSSLKTVDMKVRPRGFKTT